MVSAPLPKDDAPDPWENEYERRTDLAPRASDLDLANGEI